MKPKNMGKLRNLAAQIVTQLPDDDDEAALKVLDMARAAILNHPIQRTADLKSIPLCRKTA